MLKNKMLSGKTDHILKKHRNRKSLNKSTFIDFLEAKKVFDRFDRDLNLYKLLE